MEGCATFATVIPILLLAGHIDKEVMRRLSIMPIWLRATWLGYVAFSLVGLFMALYGASGDGVEGWRAYLVWGAALIAAWGLLVEVAGRLLVGLEPWSDREIELVRELKRQKRELKRQKREEKRQKKVTIEHGEEDPAQDQADMPEPKAQTDQPG